MSEMAHEVVGAELILGVSAISLEVRFPARQLRPPEPGKIGVFFHPGDGCAQKDQVGALLDRHHVGLVRRRLSAAVDLAVGLRIHADVVRGERKLPARRRTVDQGRRDQRLGESRAHQQKLRCGRIDDVDRGDAAVAAILLGEEERLVVAIGRQPAPGQRLTISQRSDLGIALGRRREPGQPSAHRRISSIARPGSCNHARHRAADQLRSPRAAASTAAAFGRET